MVRALAGDSTMTSLVTWLHSSGTAGDAGRAVPRVVKVARPDDRSTTGRRRRPAPLRAWPAAAGQTSGAACATARSLPDTACAELAQWERSGRVVPVHPAARAEPAGHPRPSAERRTPGRADLGGGNALGLLAQIALIAVGLGALIDGERDGYTAVELGRRGVRARPRRAGRSGTAPTRRGAAAGRTPPSGGGRHRRLVGLTDPKPIVSSWPACRQFLRPRRAAPGCGPRRGVRARRSAPTVSARPARAHDGRAGRGSTGQRRSAGDGAPATMLGADRASGQEALGDQRRAPQAAGARSSRSSSWSRASRIWPTVRSPSQAPTSAASTGVDLAGPAHAALAAQHDRRAGPRRPARPSVSWTHVGRRDQPGGQQRGSSARRSRSTRPKCGPPPRRAAASTS